MSPYATKRPEFLPMVAMVTRESKGQYIVTIKFTKSKRLYGEEMVFAPNIKLVKAHIVKLYPGIKWSKK